MFFRKIKITILLLTLFFAYQSNAEKQKVKGYTKKNGTYIPSYYRSKADGSRSNNLGAGWNKKNGTPGYDNLSPNNYQVFDTDEALKEEFPELEESGY